ncbi:LuxR C-terminal-related transcriptional regulator [Sinomicrobium weinanense]|uniref:LuxR family transcriptional regulator n=1 Tax=Sinomicrobium weinanense TaxID=2842200 RepID=A0A926Q1Y8_9FLAO|nr:LuxR C-terminal-related transcriptional regulator [Sinomicrobium weinanense]MBC9795279.1 LuxR family transcriptional regulator [Sinomicrobium weinanense]MBU3125751.1 LuxR C-terminal-related transcriptional regulator [Sinomicrobium weinanense]
MGRSLFICFFIFFTTLFRPSGTRAQSVVIDSLNTIIDNPGATNGERIEAMYKLSRILSMNRQSGKAMKMAKEALELSYPEKDKKYSAITHALLGYLYYQQDSIALAFQAIDSAQWYASRTEDKIVKGRVLSQKGWLENMVGNPDKDYEYMLEALRLFEGEEAFIHQTIIYHRLAAIHAYWKDPEKQKYYTNLCLDAALKSDDPDAITNAYLSMGNSYLNRFRKAPGQRQLLDSSKYYNRLILELNESKRKHITVPTTEGIAALNMANLYYEFYPLAYKDSARVYLDRAINVGRESDYPDIIVNSYGILSEYARKEGDYDQAEKLLNMAMTEISSNSKSDAQLKMRIAGALSRVAEDSGDNAKALKYYKQYMTFDKEFFDEEKLSITQKLEAQYQSEKKELALAAARQETAFTKKLNRYYLILIIAGLLALFFLFRSYHFKLKASQQKQLLLTGERNEAKLQASLKAEETARLEAERELMQERLDRLEKELLAGTLQVEEKNTLLQDLREKLNALDSNDPLHRQLNRLISKNYEVDKGYDDIKAEFAEIHPEFIAGLQEKAENKLTRLDLKYCSYILMGLTNKEIAIKLNVTPKSIRMARYRLKQKLKLQKDDNLDQFISDQGSRPDTAV